LFINKELQNIEHSPFFLANYEAAFWALSANDKLEVFLINELLSISDESLS
jgi:hypothetical protein